MPHELSFLQDLAVVMIVAGLVTIIFHRLRQPVVLGYIIAGVIIGPHTPPFPLVQDERSIETLAELGVILLMFSLGLHFSLRQLAQVGTAAVLAAMLEIVLMLLLGYELGRIFGWSTVDCIFLGAILSISSTTIIVKAFEDLGLNKQGFAKLVFGILIVEDILAIAMIALLSGIATTGSLEFIDVLRTLAKLSIFLIALLVAGLLSVPRLLRYVSRFKSNEMLLVAVLGLCFGVSLLAAKLGYSVALGAFMIGAIIAESREAGRVQVLIEPVRDMFSAIFFVAIGLLLDPQLLWRYRMPVSIVTIVVIVGKVITCAAGAFLAGNDRRTSLRVGMSLAQIGELSFIIAQLGLTLNKTSQFLYPIAVSVSAITTLLTPYLIRNSDRVVNLFDRVAPNSWLGYLDTYHQWVLQLGKSARGGNQLRRLMRKWALQIGLNIALVSAMLIAAKWLASWATTGQFELPNWTGGPKTVIWLVAMLAALPLLVATFRKMRAMAQVLAEMNVVQRATAEQQTILRAVVANAIFIPAALAIAIWILALSAALLPPWPVLLALLLLIFAITFIRWNTFVKVYASAQIALKSTLEQKKEPPPPAPVIPLLQDAVVQSVTIENGSAAAGKLIRELQLRTLTGASAVGIERDGASVINPGPDEELQPGDRVLLLGNDQQLAAARILLTGASQR